MLIPYEESEQIGHGATTQWVSLCLDKDMPWVIPYSMIREELVSWTENGLKIHDYETPGLALRSLQSHLFIRKCKVKRFKLK